MHILNRNKHKYPMRSCDEYEKRQGERTGDYRNEKLFKL